MPHPTQPLPPAPVSRRAVAAALGGVLAGLRALGAFAQAADRIRVGTLPFGTVNWEVETIRRNGFDARHGIRIEPVPLASNDAARIAFNGGAVDAIVSDLLFAARLRAEGRGVKFLRFSSTEGSLMVPPGSAIQGVADLAGKSIGVAGGPLDKSWLLLQAYGRKRGFDVAARSRPVYGAPPLLAEKLEVGELDAALLFWNFCARLEAKGFRRLEGAGDFARDLGLTGTVCLLGYLFGEDLARDGRRTAAFAAASAEAKALLAVSDEAWAALRPLMQAEDDATAAALRKAFVVGLPRRPLDEEAADARGLYATLAALGGERLVGAATTLPDDLYLAGPA